MQQINLYFPEFQPNREPLRSIHMLWGLAAFVVVLVLASFLSAQKNRERAQDIVQQRHQLEQMKAKVAQLEQQRPQSNLADLDAQAVNLTQELKRREQIYQVIANRNLGNNNGFSSHIRALGKQSLESVSLEAFSLQSGGNYVELAGTAQAVDQVLLYIQRLQTESAFAQSSFGVLVAEPRENQAGVFRFSLARPASGAAAAEPKSAVQSLLELSAAENSTGTEGDK